MHDAPPTPVYFRVAFYAFLIALLLLSHTTARLYVQALMAIAVVAVFVRLGAKKFSSGPAWALFAVTLLMLLFTFVYPHPRVYIAVALILAGDLYLAMQPTEPKTYEAMR